jgi:hypothetical protein
MPFCPNCGTEVGEDIRFCPECGSPFTIVGQAGSGDGKNRKKIAGIIAACIVAIIVIVIVATRPPTSMEPEPLIPAHFTTYTDEQGLFSISYPPEWELAMEYLEGVEQFSKDIISSIDSDVPVESVQFLFLAGLPTILGWDPSVIISVGPCSSIICTHDSTVNAEIEGIKAIDPGYQEISRVKTTVGGRTATILVSLSSLPGEPAYQYSQMFLTVSRTVWVVTCGVLSGEYSEWEDDFDAIVRSLRILK